MKLYLFLFDSRKSVIQEVVFTVYFESIIMQRDENLISEKR